MDAHWVGAIVEHDIRVWDAFTKVGLQRGMGVLHVGRCTRGLTLNVSTPRSSRAFSLSVYHLVAAGLVKSTIPRPGCQRSHLSRARAK